MVMYFMVMNFHFLSHVYAWDSNFNFIINKLIEDELARAKKIWGKTSRILRSGG